MTKIKAKRRVAVVGAGPAGLSATLALLRRGFEVALFERHHEIRDSGNVINLWPAPQKILRVYGVKTEGMGAPGRITMRRYDGRIRGTFNIPEDVRKEYSGGFAGLLRRDLYRRMAAAIPRDVFRFGQSISELIEDRRSVSLRTKEGAQEEFDLIVGADGIDSVVRKAMWGETAKREHRLRAILGYVFHDRQGIDECVIAHDRRVQGSYTPIAYDGKRGHGWWFVEAWNPEKPFTGDLKAHVLDHVKHFAEPLPTLVKATDPETIHAWQIKDREPLKIWSKGRATLAGDSAHPTSPYAAYGAGMAIEDGYFLGKAMDGVDLADASALARALATYEAHRRPHTSEVTEQAYFVGQMYHHSSWLKRTMLDWVFDHTSMLQKKVGDADPARSLRHLAEIEEFRLLTSVA